MNELILPWVAHYGYITIFSLLMVGILGVPVPDETLVAFAGYLAFTGELSLIPAFAAAFLGTACGITLSYGLGRMGGAYLVGKYGAHLHLTEDKLVKVRHWFGRFGRWVLLVGYFFPGIRHLTALTAGASRLTFPVFVLFAYAGGFLWSLTFILIGYSFGKEWATMSGQFRHYLLLGTAAAVLLVSAFAVMQWIKYGRSGKGKNDTA